MSVILTLSPPFYDTSAGTNLLRKLLGERSDVLATTKDDSIIVVFQRPSLMEQALLSRLIECQRYGLAEAPR